MKTSPVTDDFLSYLEQSPTAWHAVEEGARRLESGGYQRLSEADSWSLQPSSKYYVTRNGSSLCAFETPQNLPTSVCVLGSHTDSPALRLKHHGEYKEKNMILFGVEVYGGPLLSSWLNRELGLGGRVIYENEKGEREECLIRIEDHPFVIPQLAIHFDREVNTKGLLLDKQKHLAVLACVQEEGEEGSYLEKLLRKKLSYKTLLGTDLFFYPLQSPSLVGEGKQMISAYRIDNLASAHANLQGLLDSQTSHKSKLKMALLWDNEEIGSGTAQGACSPLLPDLLERVIYGMGGTREHFLQLKASGVVVSVDGAHALHPNYPEKHEPRHQPLMGKGIVLKINAQQRYATGAEGTAFVKQCCEKANCDLQVYVHRTDLPCGSTIGPLTATLTGMTTVDVGCAQLSMHSARELMACVDHEGMCRFLTACVDN